MKLLESILTVATLTTLSSLATAQSQSPITKRDQTANAGYEKTPPVTTRGNAFYANGSRFYVRGIDYQPGGEGKLADPIADPVTCKRDVEEFKKLGINTVRVYTVDNGADHDQCMQMLADAGIYIALDVNSPKYSLNRQNAKAIGSSYNDVYLQNVFATVEKFAKYDNTLLFFSGNEVINNPTNTFAAPYIKAVTRDIKRYIRSRGLRNIPVGYSSADVSEARYNTAMYMNCGGDEARSDFFAFNDYSWCSTDFHTSGWDQKVQNYTGYSIPLFLSEFGCIESPPRKWNEINALYSEQMTAVYSGGLAYEYTLGPNRYGIVSVSNTGLVTELPDFAPLAAALKASPPPPGDGGARFDLPPSQCPPAGPNWQVENESLPLTPQGADKFFVAGAGAGRGLAPDDVGSQWVGTPSSGWAVPGNVASSGSSGSSGSNGSSGSGDSGSSNGSNGSNGQSGSNNSSGSTGGSTSTKKNAAELSRGRVRGTDVGGMIAMLILGFTML